MLASRLITLAKQVPQIFRNPTIAEQIAFPMNRLAQALKTAAEYIQRDIADLKAEVRSLYGDITASGQPISAFFSARSSLWPSPWLD